MVTQWPVQSNTLPRWSGGKQAPVTRTRSTRSCTCEQLCKKQSVSKPQRETATCQCVFTRCDLRWVKDLSLCAPCSAKHAVRCSPRGRGGDCLNYRILRLNKPLFDLNKTKLRKLFSRLKPCLFPKQAALKRPTCLSVHTWLATNGGWQWSSLHPKLKLVTVHLTRSTVEGKINFFYCCAIQQGPILSQSCF